MDGWLLWLVHFGFSIFFTDFWWLAIYFRLYTYTYILLYSYIYLSIYPLLSHLVIFYNRKISNRGYIHTERDRFYFIFNFTNWYRYDRNTLCPMIFILTSQRNSTSCSIKLPPSHPRTALSRSLSPHFNSISNLYLFHKLLLYAYQLVISQNVTGSKSNDEIKKQTQTNKVHTQTHTHIRGEEERERERFIHMSINCMQPTNGHPRYRLLYV